MTQHAELIARLEAAEVGSRELDHLIFMHTAPMEVSSHWSPSDHMTLYTTSLSAALALAERVLPEASVQINTGTGWVRLLNKDGRYDYSFFASARHKNPALALCIAILRALEAKA